VSDDLTGLGPRGFERLCQALAAYVLGPGIEAFGSGPDGGREASFHGRVPYPSSADPWDGFGILQAKFKERILGTAADATWLRRQVKAELDAWADPGKARVSQGRRPDYLIVATNVPLSGVPGSGGKARIDKLMNDYAPQIGLKDWRVWDAGQITALLNAYPDVRRAFAALITPSEDAGPARHATRGQRGAEHPGRDNQARPARMRGTLFRRVQRRRRGGKARPGARRGLRRRPRMGAALHRKPVWRASRDMRASRANGRSRRGIDLG
jgi:hypothetical protein